MDRAAHVIGGIIIELGWMWLAFTGIGYLAYVGGLPLELNASGVIIGLVIIAVGTLPYWFFRENKPVMAKTTLVTLAVEVIGFLLLLPFSEL
ncbi:MAG: hypothetical protein A3B37_00040 [Candidatus Sungbacteria bacterium RIFCSPLOWO2_01_FULL_59_16]|uniref:Uncharacterized protein n=1 Tax=Candidatus Sungbacteria bacterium RIFCSPLOWO2_01_FULL_59_16 TaxID=1802280 RepID=A0A1G2LCB6_9BACT|nr:MAG: hypothetical protein A3B37_00040 [Candidatus Sungbacteria bacterium RIFCSPLOWO2_01_FULL_59_16]